jgi:2-phospho-L-lactate/phosphoenolpyruvate guanylyltransferase
MTVWAIVPVKQLGRGKSRLAGVLTKSERYELNRELLSHTLETLQSVQEIARVVVVSRDSTALAIGRDYQALTVKEYGISQLNLALKRATIVARQYTLRAVMIIPADLPLFTSEDIRTVIQHDPSPPGVVIVPDRHRKGTNALFVTPPGLIDYEFGLNSFQRHCENARRIGARLVELDIPRLALDIDLPEDLELVERERGSRILG